MIQLKLRNFVISLCVLTVVGFLAGRTWYQAYSPIRPMFVELANATSELLPSIVIEHGNSLLQEKIVIVQLQVGEKRIIALNHEPGLGFNVKVNYADGRSTEICSGRSKEHRFYRETIEDAGIYTTPIQ